ncbi:MAG: co-chaperone GroES [Gammaproteobacteria bacterium]
MKFTPLKDNVLVRRTDEETRSSGGIVIPGSAAEKPTQGEVISVGPGRTNDKGELIKIAVKAGDKIVFGQYAGSNTLKIDGDDMLIISESDILGVLSN